MNQDKMYLINKLFNDKTIRTVWDKEEEKYYVSVVDVAGAAADSDNPRKYWNWLKNKLKKEEDFELSSITRQLKLKSSDGKYYMTDVVDVEGMFRIIESIPSKNAEPFKVWLAKLGRASCRFGGSAYNFNVQNGINEWLEMRKKRENHEITDQEYIEWKLNYKLKNPLK